eukprot:CAMPEP_0119555844 /NCGR_PEP_ID=MMETSP1352-20130426/7928_1 /TAXON_ID=265584 /ORGANISM="Stauroneis constricta, Strain CCMP1120" /LENGTH=459 /DNA_ID=CAMNT_0007602687 /DNA_START=266 /DNA_END=1645 /DNA_ORIENTATION=-
MSFELDENNDTAAYMDADNGSSGDDGFGQQGSFFLFFWIVGAVVFILLPFCSTQQRRQVCWRRIRERKWGIPMPAAQPSRSSVLAAEARQRRRELAQQRQTRYQMSKTQQDEIREQFLMSRMDDYTMALTENDIFEKEDNGDDHSVHSVISLRFLFGRAGSNRSLHARRNSMKSTTSQHSTKSADKKKSAQSNVTAPSSSQDEHENPQPVAVVNDGGNSNNNNNNNNNDNEDDIIVSIEQGHNHDDIIDSIEQEHHEDTTTADLEDLEIGQVEGQEDFIIPMSPIDGDDIDDAQPAPSSFRKTRVRAESIDSVDEMLQSDFDSCDEEETDETLYIPLAGQRKPKSDNDVESDDDTEKEPPAKSPIAFFSPRRRNVPNGCAICIAPLEAGDNVTWSSNPKCSHIFHESCILHWLLTVGRKTARKRARHNPEQQDDLDKICQFPMECPCCRQDFIVSDEEV